MVTVPSPQCVGREFVRQYYTLLNQEPVQIHRFYTKQSWFLHGRAENGPSEPPVIGQEAIYSKIKELNFHDCHTKIRQVDSHSTVGGGVVVQVSGELSNDGQPMRRFMQTFVLAPGEGPKRYYVHNDIFRYQDEVFSEDTSDEPADGTVDSEGEEEHPQQVPVNNDSSYDQTKQEQAITQDISSENLYYAESGQTNGPTALLNQERVLDEEDDDEGEESLELQEVVIDKQPQIAHHELVRETAAVIQLPEEEEEEPLPANDQPGETLFEPEQPEADDAEGPEGARTEPEAPLEDVTGETTEPDVIFSAQEKPKTWAALAASRAPAAPTNTAPTTNSRPARQLQQAPAQPVLSPPPRPQPASARQSKEIRGGLGTRDARMSARNAPDNHQVFIGNLPNNVKDDEVRNVFAKYGTILEIRLNPKNFGFVIFNSPEPVEQILSNRPIKIGNHEINIEEKKPSGTFGRGSSGNRRGGSGGARGNARGGASGGGGQVGRGGTGSRSSNRGGGFGANSGGGNAGSSGRSGRDRDSGGRGGKFK